MLVAALSVVEAMAMMVVELPLSVVESAAGGEVVALLLLSLVKGRAMVNAMNELLVPMLQEASAIELKVVTAIKLEVSNKVASVGNLLVRMKGWL